jgi:hypothetical protein
MGLFGSAADMTVSMANKTKDVTMNTVNKTVDITKDAATTVGNGAYATVTDPVGTTKSVGSAAIDTTKSVGSAAVDLETYKSAGTMALDTTKAAGTMAVDTTTAVGTAAVDTTKAAVETTVETTKAAGDLVLSGVASTFETLGVTAGFQSVMGAMMGGEIDTSDEGLEKLFKEIDDDSSGKISEEEMKIAITKLYGKELDDKLIKDMMTAADTDKDGQVDIDEFKTIMRAGPEKKDA